VDPPPGYKVEVLTKDASPATEKDLVETFRRYSELSGGAFPDTLDFWALSRFSQQHRPLGKPTNLSAEQRQQERQHHANEDQRLYRGLQYVFHHLPPDADPHYAGKGVQRGAADTPIFWYRPKDSKQYRVIYADFSIRESDTPPHVPNAQAVLAPLNPQK
jgi:hypothetical protein